MDRSRSDILLSRDMKMWDSRAEGIRQQADTGQKRKSVSEIPVGKGNPGSEYERARHRLRRRAVFPGACTCRPQRYRYRYLPQKMIDAAERKAKAGGCTNAEFFALDWAAADIDERGWRENFDIVIAHMTPAVCDYASMEKSGRLRARTLFSRKARQAKRRDLRWRTGLCRMQMRAPRERDMLDPERVHLSVAQGVYAGSHGEKCALDIGTVRGRHGGVVYGQGSEPEGSERIRQRDDPQLYHGQ